MLARNHKTTVAEVLRAATQCLQNAACGSPALDARLLLQHVLGLSREALLLRENESLTEKQSNEFNALIDARVNRKPIAQLIGKREFYGREFKVTQDTLDPRPDSETLIEALLTRIPNPEPRILDLGTGTGCLLLILLSEIPNASGMGVDISDAALAVASHNAEALGVKNRVQWIKSDWNQQISGVFDIVISNPPYIASQDISGLAPEVAKYEPKLALDGGADGLHCYRIIINALPMLLSKDGVAVLEMGIGQLGALQQLVNEQPLICTEVRQDLAGIARAIVIKHKENIRESK